MPKVFFQKRCNLFCSGCSKEFQSKIDLTNHSCSVELEGLEITIKTEEESIQDENLNFEMIGENSFLCKVCQRTFNSSRGCKLHIRTHSDENKGKRKKESKDKCKKQYVCTFCPQKFVTLKEYKNHYKVHNIFDTSSIENSNVQLQPIPSETNSICLSALEPFSMNPSQYDNTIESEIYPISISQPIKAVVSKATSTSRTTPKKVIPDIITNVKRKTAPRKATTKSPKFSPSESKFDLVSPKLLKLQHKPEEITADPKELEASPCLKTKNCKKQYVCSYCNLKFQTLKTYRTHYKTHTADCKPHTTDSELLSPDYESVPANPFSSYTKAKLHQCPNCSETFQKSGSFRRHLRSHLNIRAYSCKHCLLSFISKSQLTAHIKQKCKNEEKKYSCGLCKKTFYHRMGFMRHKTEHISNPPYKCPTCGTSFPSLSKRVRHLAHHFVKCPICRKAFANDVKLWQHLDAIHPDIVDCDIPCDTSEEENDSGQDFDEMDIDSDADSYTSIDSDSSSNQETLKSKVSQQKTNNSEVCFICEQRFPNEISLNFHMQSHPIFFCGLCNKFFPHESKLKSHQSEHDQGKIFDDLLQSVQVTPSTLIPISSEATADLSETNSSASKGEETEKTYNILEWYNSFNQLLGNLKYPIGHDLYLDINNYISEMTSALYNENLSQETRDTYKKIYLRLTGIIRENGETLCG